MATNLTAEIFARAIISAAITYGDDPVEACEKERGYKRRALTAAAVGVQAACGGTLDRIAEILGLSIKNVYAARSIAHPAFVKASRSAEEAVRYHLKVKAERAAALADLAAVDADLLDVPDTAPAAPSCAEPAAEPAAEPLAAPVSEAAVAAAPPEPQDVPMVEAEAPRPAPSRPAPKAAAKPAQTSVRSVARAPSRAPDRRPDRALPKGARLVNLGDGVQRIEVKPISERVARMAAQQLDRGADLAFVADCFSVDPEALQAAIDILKGEAA